MWSLHRKKKSQPISQAEGCGKRGTGTFEVWHCIIQAFGKKELRIIRMQRAWMVFEVYLRYCKSRPWLKLTTLWHPFLFSVQFWLRRSNEVVKIFSQNHDRDNQNLGKTVVTLCELLFCVQCPLSPLVGACTHPTHQRLHARIFVQVEANC